MPYNPAADPEAACIHPDQWKIEQT